MVRLPSELPLPETRPSLVGRGRVLFCKSHAMGTVGSYTAVGSCSTSIVRTLFFASALTPDDSSAASIARNGKGQQTAVGSAPPRNTPLPAHLFSTLDVKHVSRVHLAMLVTHNTGTEMYRGPRPRMKYAAQLAFRTTVTVRVQIPSRGYGDGRGSDTQSLILCCGFRTCAVGTL